MALIGLMSNKVKMSTFYARKNKTLAKDLEPLFQLITEQLLPHYVSANLQNSAELNTIANLMHLLCQKAQQVFCSRIIHTCIDQNWDLKGLK